MTLAVSFVSVLLLWWMLAITVLCQNTRLNTQKYNILSYGLGSYVNDILLTTSPQQISLFYKISGTDLVFYFVGTSATSSLEIVFGSSQTHVYSIVVLQSGPSSCSYQDLYYDNSSVSSIYTASTGGAFCSPTGMTTIWDQTTMFRHPLTTTLFTISTNVDIDILFIDGGTPYPQTIVLYNQQVCSGTCGHTISSCDGPQYTDCLSCKDPLKVAIHNLCIPREPAPLPQDSSLPITPNVPVQIWNKQQFTTQNTSLYYGFRNEQNLDFCYFRIIIEEITTTPTWIGFSFGTTHLGSVTNPTDMVVIRYLTSPPTPGTLPIAEDWNSISGTAIPSLPINLNMFSDSQQNYQVTQGGHDGSSKWDVTLVRLCNMNQITTAYDPSFIAAYKETIHDYTPVVSCIASGLPCTFSPTPVSYTFGFVLGINIWSTVSSNPHNLYPSSSINTPFYPASDTRLVNEKYCPSCASNIDCVGPELQDCTLCKPGQQIDPHYPSTGPGVCINIIIPCHQDCATCTSSLIDGCLTCTDTNKFIPQGTPAGRCVAQRALFWNKVNLSPASALSFYYGWDTSLEFIFFRFLGNIQGPIDLTFLDTSATLTPSIYDDFVITSATFPVDDNQCTITAGVPTCSSDATRDDLIMLSGSTMTTSLGYANVTVTRAAISADFAYDVTIDNSYTGVLLRALGSGITYSLPTQHFYNYQICAINCATCSGPETADCLVCNSGYSLSASAPSSCVLSSAGPCSAACATCSTTLPIPQCLTCASSVEVIFNSNCVSKFPPIWNKIYFSHSNFSLYYGYDTAQTLIYLRLTGSNPGWVGLSYMARNKIASNKHFQTDMVILRKVQGQLVIEDRLSLDLAEPFIDTNYGGKSSYQYIRGDRDSEGKWDVYFLRAVNPADTQGYDFNLVSGVSFVLSFAMGDTDIPSGHTMHTSIVTTLSTTQICDKNCLTCSGPELYHCLTCKTGFSLSESAPARCILTQKRCHPSCSTCSGPLASNCLTCSDSVHIQLNSTCIDKSPQFWNKLSFTPSLFLYYGYNKLLDQIYFRIKGTGSTGWIGLAFQSSKQQMDTVVLRYVSSSLVIEDRYTENHDYRPEEDLGNGGYKNYVLITGSRIGSAWDATFTRKINTNDPVFDSIITQGSYTLSLALGTSDSFDSHIVPPLYLPGVLFQTNQVCDTSCDTCSGPETTDCLTCLNGYVLLASTAPSSCVLSTITCHSSCITCSGTGAADCLTCTAPTLNVLYDGYCIGMVPNLWNRIDVTTSFVLYYGYDSGGSFIYFRAKGNAPGWFGVGFNSNMVNTDMNIVRLSTGVEDRYSLGHATPMNDLQNNLLTISCSIVSGTSIDCTWVRYVISPDSVYDSDLQFDVTRSLIFAFGSSSTFLQHTSTIVLTNVVLSRSQICHESCLTCSGPNPTDCITTNSATATSTTTYTVPNWNQGSLNAFHLIIFMLAFVAIIF